MDSKWFVILFMLASFLYRIYKKGKQDKTEDVENKAGTDWGLDELISKFNPESQYSDSNDYTEQSMDVKDNDTWDYTGQDPEIVEHAAPKVVKNTWDENADHRAFKSKKEETYSSKVARDIEIDEDDFDLKKMVISNAILNRPEF